MEPHTIKKSKHALTQLPYKGNSQYTDRIVPHYTEKESVCVFLYRTMGDH